YKPELDALTSLQLILKTVRLAWMIRGDVEKGYYTLHRWWRNDFFASLPMPTSEVLYHELEFYRDPREYQTSGEEESKREAQIVLWEKLHVCAEALRKVLKVLETMDPETEGKVLPDNPNW
ncbi:hypothetical protein B0T20DRAFT_365293, partial [Sordaria brevicollis]